MSTWSLEFRDLQAPPLTSNQRMHWGKRAGLTKGVRFRAATEARHQGIPPLGACEVRLIWHVTTLHRRDADNVVPTLKALCDGLVDAGIVTDDTPDLMVKHMPHINYVGPGGRGWLELTIEQIGHTP